MRGPGYKLTGDVRRTWRCSRCGRERKMSGETTTLICGCGEQTFMQIVAERINAPRPLQRPSDVERRPIDFGVEPLPAAPVKPEATIVKSAIDRGSEPADETPKPTSNTESTPPHRDASNSEDDNWGDGIL